ncbi:MAG TPA: 50S ribosomal protein L3 [Verrucomicrobiales bacterium]|nr:50S ribosomal protein L3 [Verrucomicrobiales bacterium]
MSLGLLGRKLGMTRVYAEDGTAVPVTVLDVRGNVVVQIKRSDGDGYAAVQVGFGEQKEQRLNKPSLGHLKKRGCAPKRWLREFRFAAEDELPAQEGAELPASLFQMGQYVDVIGVTKGKGFQGVVKRFGFGGLPQTHGSMMHRRPGAIGCGTTPGRLWKGTKLPGRHGNYRRTVQNLQVIQVREEDGALLISGSFPGAKGSLVLVRPAKKKPLPAAVTETAES